MSVIAHDDFTGESLDGEVITLSVRYWPRGAGGRYEPLDGGDIKTFKNGENAGKWIDDAVQGVREILESEMN